MMFSQQRINQTLHYYIILFLTVSTAFLARRTKGFVLLPPTRTYVNYHIGQSKQHQRTFILRMSSSSDANPFKRVKLESREDLQPSSKIIGTHSGSFQADEALGVWLLRQTPEYFQSKVVRTRNYDKLEELDIVIDVGGIYDDKKLRYDHHQRGYDERFDEGKKEGQPRCSKLSASGLVYRHYGKQVISQFYPNLSKDQVDLVYLKMYNSFMETIDAIDTGVEMIPSGLEATFSDRTGLASRVGRLNPRWNEVDPSTGEKPKEDERFEEASALCGSDFLSVLTTIVESDLPAKEIVKKALLKRFDVDPSGEIMTLESGGLPWKNHLYDLEEENSIEDPDSLIKFVLYTDQTGMWRIQAVTVKGTMFENRLSLPEEWRGVRDQDLEKVSGVKGATFCHAAGFIGGNNSYEGALEMARIAISKK